MRITAEITPEEYEKLPPDHPLRALIHANVDVTLSSAEDEQSKAVLAMLTPEFIAAAQARYRTQEFLKSTTATDRFVRMRTPWSGVFSDRRLVDKHQNDEEIAIEELRLAGIPCICTCGIRKDPVVLAVHRAVPTIIGALFPHVLFRYETSWAAFKYDEDHTDDDLSTVLSTGRVLHTQTELLEFSKEVIATYSKQSTTVLYARGR